MRLVRYRAEHRIHLGAVVEDSIHPASGWHDSVGSEKSSASDVQEADNLQRRVDNRIVRVETLP